MVKVVQNQGDPKYRDPYIFIPAEQFFDYFTEQNGVQRPESIVYSDDDQNPDSCKHGRIFRFNDGKLLHVQFIRPLVWRLRFHAGFAKDDYTDSNTRTIVQDKMEDTIALLDISENIKWHVELVQSQSDYYVLQSVRDDEAIYNNRRVVIQLWIQKDPFQISAVRSVMPYDGFLQTPDSETPDDKLKTAGADLPKNITIWETDEQPLAYKNVESNDPNAPYVQASTMLSVKKSYHARHLSFGEQGGRSLFKTNAQMNYFNYDNMRYYNVYGDGPYNDAEPLYHSEPYWLEVNTNPGYPNIVGTFIDNYSHVCIDLGFSDPDITKIATRFNSFQGIFMAGDNVAQIIRLYTSLVGTPWLKPRYTLGYHQGCYGYDTQSKVQDAVAAYRQAQIPLDGMHIDVDIQKAYQTFTIDLDAFPTPEDMFKSLRQTGVKCSTNITPFIYAPPFEYVNGQSRPDTDYAVFADGMKNDVFIKDVRDLDPSVPSASSQRYLQFGDGTEYLLDPNTDHPGYGDPYDFSYIFNNGDANDGRPPEWKLFHGGVDYGGTKGKPGVYANLNNADVRKWWGMQYQYLFQTGLEFVWQDMTSPCMSQSYGDMKSFPFRLLIDSDGWSDDPRFAQLQPRQKAIELWSLYSYNLHKATFQGLSDPQIAPTRVNKRNFIIGRGSFAGAQRYAGLWTGDNSSTWEFFDISVAQVLALGVAGVSIAGADVGGFECKEGENLCADPELFIRWNLAYSLLPWYRNHYSAKPGSKQFQEPYAYEEYYQKIKDDPNTSQRAKDMFQCVQPLVRYQIRLRYSLMQLLYDAMFESVVNGLPIARAMFITDPYDWTLFGENQWFCRSQYMVRNDLLVAPALYPESTYALRKLYLPLPSRWYTFNLRLSLTPPDPSQPDIPQSVALQPSVRGGDHLNFDCRLNLDEGHTPYVLPMFVREGAIIPQINPQSYTPNRTSSVETQLGPNPITLHIYPGQDNTYQMYLDDGVSRDSAPNNAYLSAISAPDPTDPDVVRLNQAFGDQQAMGRFRQVQISQTTKYIQPDQAQRTVSIRTVHGLRTGDSATTYTQDEVKRDIGDTYTIVLWHAPETNLNSISFNASSGDAVSSYLDRTKAATVVTVPVEAQNEAEGITIVLGNST